MSTAVSIGILASGLVFGVGLMLDVLEQARIRFEKMEEEEQAR